MGATPRELFSSQEPQFFANLSVIQGTVVQPACYQLLHALVMRCLMLSAGLSAGLCLTSPLLAHRPVSMGPLLAVQASGAVAEPEFYVESVRLRANRVLVLPMKVSEVADEDASFEVRSSDEEVITVEGDASVLKDRAVGYVQVITGQPGEATLRLGWQELAVTVEDEPGVPALEGGLPRITSPVTGALLWGELAVAVEIPRPLTSPERELRRLRLRAGNRLISDDPVEVEESGEPLRRYTFPLDVDGLPEGPQVLTVEAQFADGTELTSEPVGVGVLRVNPGQLIAGETEDVRYRGEERPRRFGRKQPNIQDFDDASGGKVSAMYGGYPSWCLPVTVEAPGHYQMIVRAAGQEAAGAYPSLRLHVGDDEDPVTMGRLSRGDFHRVAVGTPFELEAGEQLVALAFANDFRANKQNDRNLFLDRYELLRVDPLVEEDALDELLALSDGLPVIAVTHPLHERLIGGEMTIEALTRRPMGEGIEKPKVTVWVNGQMVAMQQSVHPGFTLSRGHLRTGANQVHLEADYGEGLPPARTPTFTVFGAGEVERSTIRRHLRFPVTGEGWSDFTHSRIQPRPNHRDTHIAALFGNATVDLELPDSLEGEFDLLVDGYAQAFKGPAKVRVALIDEAGERVFDPDGHGFWSHWKKAEIGEVSLRPGKKFVRVTFFNDLYEPDKGDRNFFLRSVVLREKMRTPDTQPPRVEILYPPNGHALYGGDVIIARIWDEDRLDQVDLIHDGKPLRMAWEVVRGEGLLVLPIPTYGLEPVRHTFEVLARDASRNEGRSAQVTVELLEEPPAEPTAYARAVHLLNRFGYGPEPQEIARILLNGERAWLEQRLDEPAVNPAALNARVFAALRHRNPEGIGDVQLRALEEWVQDPNPVRARFNYFTQNHFSTWIRKTGAERKLAEHLAFSQAGFARFGDLLWTSATSPAMLHYLDQQKSFKGRLNENYAREILELHTFGVDNGYVQEDVTRLAGLLTGWTFTEEASVARDEALSLENRFRFAPDLNDPETQEVVGLRLESEDDAEQFERVQYVMETLAAAPFTARYIATKLAEHYVSVPASDALVADLARVYLETGGSMRDLMLALSEHPEFWAARSQPRLAKPVDFGLRVYRVTEFHEHPHNLRRYLQQSGTGIFEHPTPDGLPEADSDYASSNALLQRWRFVSKMSWALWRLAPPGWRHQLQRPNPEVERQLVQYISQGLTGYPLDERSLEAAMQALATSRTKSTDRVHEVTAVVGMMPETNFR